MKRIIVCSDGTWNTPDNRWLTNVVKFARSIAPVATDGKQQIVFYDQGVGTGNLLDRITGGAFGSGLDQNIEDAYTFVMNNYEPGDELFFFGFSRGAYTVRSTIGLIRKAGLLRKIHSTRFGEAYRLYRDRVLGVDSDESKEFRNAFSREVEIKFLGVWDTVGSLGIPILGPRFLTRRKYEFHDLELSKIVKNAYHAVAIDEKRWPFTPALWSAKPKPGQIVEQVWFAGCHSDVGGGCKEPAGLPDVTYKWMKEKAELCDLAFDSECADIILADSNPEGVLHNSSTGLYWFIPRRVRKIGDQQYANQSVSAAARERLAKMSSYRPKNLLEYLASVSSAGED